MVSGEDMLKDLSAHFFSPIQRIFIEYYYVSDTVWGSGATEEEKTYRALITNQDPFQMIQRPNHKAQKP